MILNIDFFSIFTMNIQEKKLFFVDEVKFDLNFIDQIFVN